MLLLYQGGWYEKEIIFRILGDLHQARWKEKAVYTLKIVLFAKQLDTPQGELKGIKQVAYFVSLSRFWRETIVCRWAPKNDLDMLQLLSSYTDADVKNNTLTVAKRRLWNLSETDMGLAFLDERITQTEKENML